MENLKEFEGNHNPEIDEKFHQLDIGNIGNVLYWDYFLNLIADVPGDIVECGIGRGRSLTILTALNLFRSKDKVGERNIYGYDSFAGFPEPSNEDDSYRKPKKGEWSTSPSGRYEYSPKFISSVLDQAGLNVSDRPLKLVKGYFGDTLPDHPKEQIALLHVDGDLYQSYMDTLNNLYPLVAKGGVIVFDDFVGVDERKEKFPGARLAVKEFLGEEYANLQISLRGTTYYVKKD